MKAKYIIIAIPLFFVLSCGPGPEENANQVKPITQDTKLIRGIARIEPEKGLLDLTASSEGLITSILVQENDIVREGQLIAVLDNRLEHAQLEQALTKLGTQQSQILANQASASVKKSNVDKAKIDYDRNKSLLDMKATTAQVLTDSKFTLFNAEQEYQEALATLEQSRNKLKELQADVNYYKVLVSQKEITAPYDGKILALDIHIGDNVSVGTSIGTFAPSGNIIARTEVDELFVDKLKNGQKAIIYSQASNKEIAKGTVSFIGDYLKKKSLFDDETTTEDRRVKEVLVTLDRNSHVLIGSKVDCSILFY